jgi:hypothetical protein
MKYFCILFFTATPRHYDVSKQDNEGHPPTVYSMQVPQEPRARPAAASPRAGSFDIPALSP